MEAYLKRRGIEQAFGTQERTFWCPNPRSMRRCDPPRTPPGGLFHGDLYAVYVSRTTSSTADQQTIEQNLAAAPRRRAHVEMLTGEDPIGGILNSPIATASRKSLPATRSKAADG